MFVRVKCFAPFVLLLALVGCANKNTRYSWCDYDNALYNYYREPVQRDEFVAAMKEAVEKAEEDGKVPPGFYAEYGFLMYEQGNVEQAILFFRKEADKWPESKYLMARMIENTQKRTAKKSPETNPDRAGKEADKVDVGTENTDALEVVK